jgi:group I intron endonuclease
MRVSGIYKIVNKTNGKYYIGSANDIVRRWREHKTTLELNKHPNDYLQSSWNKYGKDNFDFFIIENVLPNDLLITEQKYLDIAKTEQNKCYNLKFESHKVFFSDYVKQKLSNSHKGKKHSEETKLKMSITHFNKNRGIISPAPVISQIKRKVGGSKKGRIVSDETKQRMRERMKGNQNARKNQPQSLSPGLVTI